MDPAVFDEIESTLAAEGPAAALDRLAQRLRQRKDYHGLFYALLMKKRHELGVVPLPTGPAQDLPPATHESYEQAIREAGRLVGKLFLDEGNIPQAWAYFRMLGEPGPVRDALDRHTPGEDEDVQQLIQIALYEGVHPQKGFGWVLERYGICNAITTLGGYDFSACPDARTWCIGRAVRALHDELRERLINDITRREGKSPEEDGRRRTIPELLAGRDWLFEDEFAHIDVSHLSSVVQMSAQLPPGEELELARELCAYGERLSGRLQYPGDPPFEDQYRDYGIYLAILAGENVEEGLAHFRRKADEADPETVGTFPAEVLVNLLLRLERPAEALAVARRHLARGDGRQLTCPGIAELCRLAGDWRTLAEVARQQGDAVHFLAGMLAARGGGSPR